MTTSSNPHLMQNEGTVSTMTTTGNRFSIGKLTAFCLSAFRVLTFALTAVAAIGASAEVTYLEYIDILGPSGYFDTGVPARSGVEVEVDFMPYAKGSIGYVIGRSSNRRYYIAYTGEDGKIAVPNPALNANNLTVRSLVVPAPMQRHVLRSRYALGFEGYWLDDELLYSNTPEEDFNLGVNFTAFGRKGWSSTADGTCRCYGLKFWSSDASGETKTLLCDLRPCKADGRLAFRDEVSGNLFYPADDCSWGSPTTANGGIPVRFYEYLDFNGQAIDIGVTGKSGLEAEADMTWLSVPNDAGVVGARTGNTRFYLIDVYPGKWTFGYGQTYSSAIVPAANTRCSVVSHLDEGGQWLKVDGVTVQSASVANAVDTGLNLYVGAINYDGDVRFGSKMRLYSLVINRKNSDTGEWEKIRDLRPGCIGAAVGLFDVVSEQFMFPVNQGFSRVGNLGPELCDEKPVYLDFIETDGTGYTDTLVTGKSGLESELDVAIFGTGNDQALLASRIPSGDRFYMADIYPSKWNIGYKDNIGEPSCTVSLGKRVLVHSRLFRGEQTLTIDGEVRASASVDQDVDTKRSLYLFGCHDSEFVNGCAVRFYGAKIWRRDEVSGTNVLVRDFRPARCGIRAALYDEVDKRFFFNLGNLTGSFYAGPRRSKHPVRCEYVESDGRNFVDVDVPARSGIEVTADMMWNEVPNNGCILGARNGDTRFFPIYSYPGKWDLGYGGNNNLGIAPVAGVRYSIASRLAAGEQWFKVNGDTIGLLSAPETCDTENNLHLFAIIQNLAVTCYSKARIYSLTISELDTESGEWNVVRDFHPCTCDGIAGLHDSVSGKVFYPGNRIIGADTHPLISGPKKNTGLAVFVY